MAILAEEIVEEWLNRNGFFTIRGIKLGVHEIDLLAIGYKNSEIICRHLEVTASVRPLGYISPLPPEIQDKGTRRSPRSVKKRSPAELVAGVKLWVNNKFLREDKDKIRKQLFPGEWKHELVIDKVKYEEEVELIEQHGIKVYRLDDVVKEMSEGGTVIRGAAGSDLLELVMMGKT